MYISFADIVFNKALSGVSEKATTIDIAALKKAADQEVVVLQSALQSLKKT